MGESIKDLRVKFNASKNKSAALASEELNTIHFTTDGAIVLNGREYADGSTKVDKVSGATAGNFPAFNSSGGIVDSGKSASNFAPLVDGKVPAANLPSYVDDIIELVGAYYNSSDNQLYRPLVNGSLKLNATAADCNNENKVTPQLNVLYATGGLDGSSSIQVYHLANPEATQVTAATLESGKIYLIGDTNKLYRWSGSYLAEVSSSLALGETANTAYAGNKGAAAYAHGVTNKGVAVSGFKKLTTNAEGHVTEGTDVAKSDIVALGIADRIEVSDITALTATQLNALKTGDVVVKVATDKKYAYTVAYKDETVGELNLVYADNQSVICVQYKKVSGSWTYDETNTSNIGVVNTLNTLLTWE